MKKIILVKYGELSTKGDNRHIFVNLLKKNIEKLIDEEMIIKQKHARIYIESTNVTKVVEKLSYIFGIQSYAISYQTANQQSAIVEAIFQCLNESKGKTFKVITKRALKSFETTSDEFNNIVGALVLEKTKLKVDVKKPDIKIYIEIREEGTFVYTNVIKGLGGYPVGTQGRGLLMLSGGIDSPVAGFLAMKRGIDLVCLYFESPPHTNDNAKNKVINLVKQLNNYSGSIKLLIAPLTAVQENIYQTIPLKYNIILLRRRMYQIAEQIAKDLQIKIIINGESIGQVASQTIESIMVVNQGINLPIIRPVACLDKLEIIDIAKKINTYEISIMPHLDCCTVFLAKHPVTKPALKQVLEYEDSLDENLVNQAIKKVYEIKIPRKEVL